MATDYAGTSTSGALVSSGSNIMESLYASVAQLPYFDRDEQALYNPLYHQVVKMRNNKMMDIFVDNNTGLRIDPATQSVNVMANHLKNHVHHVSAWLTGSREEYIKGNTKTKIGGTATIDISGDAVINVKGNVNANVQENATINVAKTVTVTGRDIDLSASRRVRIDGSQILIGVQSADEHNAARWEDYYETDSKGRRTKHRRVGQSGKVWIGG